MYLSTSDLQPWDICDNSVSSFVSSGNDWILKKVNTFFSTKIGANTKVGKSCS